MKKNKARSQNEIIKEIARSFGCSLAQAKRYLLSLAGIMAEDLRNYGAVNLPQIGKFTKHIQAPHKGRNPKTGETVQVPAKLRVLFKAKKNLTDKISSKTVSQKNLP
jgi:nucleoid DNA-binding protein